jgi:uncharacterized protein YciI
MQYLAIFRVEPSMHDPQQIAAAREQGFAFFSNIASDPRVKASGHFADARGGFLLIEHESAEEILQLTGPFMDFVRFECHPVVSFATLMQTFAEHNK